MEPITEESILKLILERGYLPQSRVEELRRELGLPQGNMPGQSGQWRLVSCLLERGDLPWEVLQALLQELKTGPSVSGGVKPEAGADPSPEWRYSPESFLGAGTMGEVYKAYDRQLRRHVALKWLKQETPEMQLRFLREARAQAGIEHENICRIYDIGEHGGRSYIAMQYIEGRTLKQAASEIGLEAKVNLVQEVALALNTAHSRGLIHRDVKPANIMVETGADGRRKPYIMDFGLVRDLNRESMVSIDGLVGSPFYMPPEQVSGDAGKIDRRSDVYSLGVTLYEILSGELPFTGNNLAQVMLQILHDDPRPLRRVNPAVPLDLETIVNKCLEKEPDRRYGSARELAEDLGRFLEGEPILAKRYGPGQRLLKKMKKHKVVTLLTAGFSLALLILAGMWLQARVRARTQASMASRFGQDVQEMESVMRIAHLLKPHDIRPDREQVREKMEEIRRSMKELGSAADGPGNYALGQGYLALRDFPRAREHLEKALQKGFRTPELSFALGLTLGELYQAEVRRADRISEKKMQEAEKKRLHDEYVLPSLRMLASAKRAKGVPAGYAEALIAFYEQRFEDALKIIAAAIDPQSKFYELKLLEGRVYQEMSNRLWKSGSGDAAAQRKNQAIRAYQEAREIGRSDPAPYMHLAEVYQRIGFAQTVSHDNQVENPLARAAEYCQQTLQLDPKQVDAYIVKAYICCSQAYDREWADAQPFLHSAQEAADRAVALQPDEDLPHYVAGKALQMRGEHTTDYTQDFCRSMEQAIGHFSRCLSLNPNYLYAQIETARTQMILARHQFFNGRDFSNSIGQGVRLGLPLAERFPANAEVHFLCGSLLFHDAWFRFESGREFQPQIGQAVKHYRQAMAITPQNAEFPRNCGLLLIYQAQWQAVSGIDPKKLLAEAMQLEEKAAAINANNPAIPINIGAIHNQRAYWQVRHGIDPGKELRQAEASLQKAWRMSAKAYELYPQLLLTQSIRCQWDDWSSRSSPGFAWAAEKAFRAGLAADDGYYELFNAYAGVLIAQARLETGEGFSREQTLAPARENLKKALTIKPNSYAAHRLLAEVMMLEAINRLRRGQNPESGFAAAEREIAASLRINPRRSQTHALLAELNLLRSQWLIGQKKEAGAAINDGLAAAARALEFNPDDAEVWLTHGLLLRMRLQAESDPQARKKIQFQSDRSIAKAQTINPLFKNSRFSRTNN